MRGFFGKASLWLCLCGLAGAQNLSGPLSGTLGPGTFTVVADISVDAGDSLTILPGTTLRVDGAYIFSIYGYLYAVGTPVDSIEFIWNNPNLRWKGMVFFSLSNDNSIMQYCRIEGSDCQGIEINASNPTISHCRIENNMAGVG